MKKFLLATVALAALGTSASAADLAARPYTKAPPMMVAVYNWSGFYVGVNGGWASSRKSWDQFTAAGVLVGAEGSHDASGGVVGGQVGYRWQTGAWVFGLEAQGDWADLSGSNASLLRTVPGLTNRSKIDALGLFTGQVGYAWNNALLYVKGGAGVVSDKYNGFVTTTGLAVDSARETRWGGAVGVGLEYGFAPNWSAAVEYDHVFLGRKSNTFTTPTGAFSAVERIGQDLDMVTARINYRWGGPVVAKY